MTRIRAEQPTGRTPRGDEFRQLEKPLRNFQAAKGKYWFYFKPIPGDEKYGGR